MRVKFAAWVLACVALLSVSAFAQQTSGTILGRVLDGQGAAIPGASVTARNPSTGFTRTVVSDAVGVYRLSALNVGQYEVTVELAGFSVGGFPNNCGTKTTTACHSSLKGRFFKPLSRRESTWHSGKMVFQQQKKQQQALLERLQQQQGMPAAGTPPPAPPAEKKDK